MKESSCDFCAHGQGYLLLKEPEKAKTEFESALMKNPFNVDAMMGLSMIYSQQKNSELEQKWVERALDQCPFLHSGLVTLARIHLQHQEFDEALKTIEVLKEKCNPSSFALYLEGAATF